MVSYQDERVGHRREDMICRKETEASRESQDASCADRVSTEANTPGEAEPNRASRQTGQTGLDSERRLN